MAIAINRDTKQIYRSVSPRSDFPDPPWILDPDLSAVPDGTPPKYIIIEGDVPREMDAAEKAVADADEAAADLQAEKDEASMEVDRRSLRAFAAVVLDEINLLRDEHGLSLRTAEQLRTALQNKIDTLS